LLVWVFSPGFGPYWLGADVSLCGPRGYGCTWRQGKNCNSAWVDTEPGLISFSLLCSEQVQCWQLAEKENVKIMIDIHIMVFSKIVMQICTHSL